MNFRSALISFGTALVLSLSLQAMHGGGHGDGHGGGEHDGRLSPAALEFIKALDECSALCQNLRTTMREP